MKKIIVSLSLLLLAIVALGVEVSAQKTKKVCYYRCYAVKSKAVKKKVVKAGCNECARLDKLEADLLAEKNKPAAEIDWSRVEKLERDIADLVPRVERLDGEVKRLDERIDGADATLAKFIAASGERFERVETRVETLETKCYAVADGNKLRNSCTGQRIKTGMGKGWKILTLVNTGLGVAGLVLPVNGGGNSNTAGVAPGAQTGPSFQPPRIPGTGGSFVPRIITDL